MRPLRTLLPSAVPALAVAALVVAGTVSSGPASAPAPTVAPALSLVSHGGEHVRLAGQDRYGTAAAVSQDAFPDGSVSVVHVVTGLGFADALAAGPAAAVLGGPVLPVATDTIPAVIAAELERLRPGRIVVAGGTAAVSSEVEQALGQYTDGGVTRAAGGDRYQTAAAVALAAFDGPVPQVLIATGERFADALAGGAVGATTGSPVLLVRPDGLPVATAAALRELQPTDIAVLGGPAAIRDSVLAELDPYTTGGVNRLAGPDRAGTAARLAEVFWPQTAGTGYLATGQKHPDALAAVPAAGTDDAPLLLTQQDCLPAATAAQLDRLQPQTVVVVGGPAAVSDQALSTPCSAAAPTPAADCDAGAAASYENTAQCLYAAFLADDRQAPAQYATPEAVEQMFSLGGYPTDDQWTFHGCDELGEFNYQPSKVCHFQIPYDVHPTYVQMAMRDDYVVEQVLTVG